MTFGIGDLLPGMSEINLRSAEGLKQLWEDRIAVILSNLEHHEEQHREIANAASQIGTDYHGRFLIELIQNASDQVAKAAGTVSTIVIVRAHGHIAVLNEGTPFDKAGVKRITSLALSGKNAEENLGNKGIGFKAVFQVSDGPEIYSAKSADKGVRDDLGYAFRLDSAPLSHNDVRAEMRSIVERLIVDRPGARAALIEKDKDKDLVDVALDEIAAAAPWKFPLPCNHTDLERRIQALELRDEWLESMQTLVILPLAERISQQDVAEALREIRSETALLFLPRIREIIIIDHVDGTAERIQKKTAGPPRQLAKGAEFSVWELSSGPLDAEPTSLQRWWVVSRTMGATAGISEQAAKEERRTIKEATVNLPGEGWSEVEHATVSVGLPHPASDTCAMQPERGLFCIGLPTRLETGTPLWVDAHFHGTVPRTGIDFTLPYNRLLFDEAARLVVTLLDDLKNAKAIEGRRSVSLAMEWSDGALAKRLRDSGLAKTAVVLAADGVSYIAGSELAMPKDDVDAKMLDVLTNGDTSAAREAGFVFPEAVLFVKKRALLDSLAPKQHVELSGHDERFLARCNGANSLLERAAQRCRGDGPGFWQPFLDWATTRFSTTELEDQVILPVGARELASAKERVFIEPMPKALETDDDDDEIDVSTMPDEVRRVLRFLDGTAVPVRVTGRRDLTPVASKLSPARGPVLVAPARIEQLIEHAVAPKLAETAADPTRCKLALELLRFAAALARRLSSKAQSTPKLANLLVPAGGHGKPWEWVDPNTIYFGEGWTDDSNAARTIEAAFGHRSRGLLVPWREFAMEAEATEEDRGSWFRGLQVLGVATHPRLLVVDGVSAFKAWSYDQLTPMGVSCPIRSAAPFWDTYQRALARRGTDRKTGHVYEIARVSWIDGLEHEESRGSVFQLALERAEDYARDATTTVRRVDLGNATEVHSLWAHAIISGDWPIIPIEAGTGVTTAPPSVTWWLSSDERRRESSKLLAAPPASLAAAEPLLKKLGIVTIPDANPLRLIHGLHQLSALTDAFRERPSAARALVGELWDRLRAHCIRSRTSAPLDLHQLINAPVPLFRGRALEIVDLRQIETVFVNDDPIRGAFVPGLDGSLQLPPLRDVQALVDALRSVIGEHRVVMTTEAPVVTFFTPSPGEPPLRFFDAVAVEFPEIDVPVDLALLRTYVGRADVDPQKREFADFWTSMERLVVQRGIFGGSDGRTAPRYFYDKVAGVLQIAHDATPLDMVVASWPLATVSHREVWIAYAKALSDESVEQFFAERQIGEAERELIESITRRGRITRLSPLRSVAFAIVVARQISDRHTFDAEWEERAGSISDLNRWLGGELEEALMLAISAPGEEDAVIPLLRAAGVSIAAWQDARVALELPRWSFSKSRESFVEARDVLVAALKSEPVRFPTIDLAVAMEAIEAVSALTPTEKVLTTFLDFDEALELVASRADEIFTKVRNRAAIATLAERVSGLANASRGERRAKLDALGTLREKEIYRRDPEAIRSHQAKEERDNLLKVAVPLAEKQGEALDQTAVLTDPRIAVFSDGWWANRWAVLVSLQRVIDAAAPKTAQALSGQRAFRDHMDWRLLWVKFPELGDFAAADVVPKPPPRKIALFGRDERVDALEEELRSGSAGKIGKSMQELIDPSLEVSALGAGTRATLVEATSSGGRGRGRGGGGGGGGPEVRADRELNGLLGEIFVYEQLRLLLDDFDEYAWKSENRSNYGFSAGHEGLGYDFLYVDRTGKLGGRPGVECKIEVKATSGDGTEPFPITMGEWECAEACHYSNGKSDFLIIRVADVRTAPRISDIIRDPFALWKARSLSINARDLWLRVATAATVSPPH